MNEQFGPVRADAVARDQTLQGIGDGGATAMELLAAGVEPRDVWLAVCEQFDVPPARRH